MSGLKIGNVEITALLDMELGLPLAIVFPGIPAAKAVGASSATR